MVPCSTTVISDEFSPIPNLKLSEEITGVPEEINGMLSLCVTIKMYNNWLPVEHSIRAGCIVLSLKMGIFYPTESTTRLWGVEEDAATIYAKSNDGIEFSSPLISGADAYWALIHFVGNM